MLKSHIEDRIRYIDGNYAIYYYNLSETNKDFFVGNTNEFISAGIIKLFVFIEAMRHIHEGITDSNKIFILKNEEKAPSIGALAYVHEGLELTFKDLYMLMIAVSDNTATNMLIDHLGLSNINKTIKNLDIKNCHIKRKFFDFNAVEAGIENTFSIKSVGKLFYKLYNGEVFSPEISKIILDTLKLSQRDYIMPHYFKEKIDIAHQMGEETEPELTHDVGIVFGEVPFILCMATQNVNTTIAQEILRDISLMCYKYTNEKN